VGYSNHFTRIHYSSLHKRCKTSKNMNHYKKRKAFYKVSNTCTHAHRSMSILDTKNKTIYIYTHCEKLTNKSKDPHHAPITFQTRDKVSFYGLQICTYVLSLIESLQNLITCQLVTHWASHTFAQLLKYRSFMLSFSPSKSAWCPNVVFWPFGGGPRQ